MLKVVLQDFALPCCDENSNAVQLFVRIKGSKRRHLISESSVAKTYGHRRLQTSDKVDTSSIGHTTCVQTDQPPSTDEEKQHENRRR